VSDSAVAGSINEAATPGRPRAFDTILYGGLVVGVLDISDAMAFFGIRNGVTPTRVLQSVAGGLLGRASFSGGLKTALLGLLLHFLIAFILATVYYVAVSILPLLIRHAVSAGLIYGVIVYFVMTYVVVPHSAVGPRSAPIPWGVFLNGIIGHALLVGLPIALIARRSAKADKRDYRSPS
jgi:uncharacterized membrane protein YagU involved in acid resistance